MLLRTVRSAVCVRHQHGRGVVLAGVAAAGTVAGTVSAHARTEGTSGRWEWPSLGDDRLQIRAPVNTAGTEKTRAPPPLSPAPQTSQPVFSHSRLENVRLARIRQYEEDIRKLSTAEKVFAYFASSANEDGVPRMTPHDLLRAMVRVDKQRKSLPPTARFIHSLVRF